MPSLIPNTVDLSTEDTANLKDTALEALHAAPSAERKDAIATAADSLTSEQRLELAKELASRQWPTGDWPKVAIYITGFVVAGFALVLMALIAWQAQSETGSVASDLVVAGSSFTSLVVGGLVGAYVQR